MLAGDVQIEHWPERTRIDLPRRELGNWRYLGLIPVAFGILFGWMPGGMVARFIGNVMGGRFDPMELVFLAFISVFLIVACFPIGFGLLLMFGRTRVVVSPDRIKITEIAGPVRYSRRIPSANIARIEIGRPRRDGVASPLMKLGALTAFLKNGKQAGILLGYPDEMLQMVSSEIVTRLRMSGAEAPVTERTFEGKETAEPETVAEAVKPSDSNVVVGQAGNGLELTVPPRGFRKESWGLFGFSIFWLLIVSGVSVGFLLPLLKHGSLQSWGALPFLLAGEAIGMAMLLTSIHLGRRVFTIRANRSRLEVFMKSPLRSRQWTWQATELSLVAVGDSGTKVNEKSLLQLQVHNQAGKKQGLLTGRDPEELRWLAWTLNQALGLEGRLTAAASAAKFPLQKP